MLLLNSDHHNGPHPKLCEAIQVRYTICFMNAILSFHFRVVSDILAGSVVSTGAYWRMVS